jgi:vacuolar-type H+-ATPase subunit H
MNINKLEAETSAFPHKVQVNEARLVFNNRYVELPALKVQIGKNDISATGKLENFIAYALQNKTLKGKLNIQSNYLNMNDFMTKSVTPATSDSASAPMNIIRIPSNIDFDMQANVEKLLYEKMVFDHIKGQLTAANSELKLKDVGLNGFGGALVMNGLYSTADTLKPKVDLDVQIKEVVFKEIFSQVETLQKFAPVLGKAAGKFSTSLKFNSLLKDNMTPDLATVLGGGAFKTQQVGLSNVPALDMLASKLNKSDIIPMTIKDLAMHFEIKDGKLTTKPFDFKVKDMNFTLGGSTGIDKSIAYLGKVQLPDRLNLGKFSTINFKMGGTFQKPKVELDLKNTATDMVKNVKEKVEAEVTKKAEDVKEKALEEARKQKENAIKEATEKADKLIAEAERQGNTLIDEAKKQGENLVAKATNPITKKAAELGAKKLEETARKQAASLVTKAKAEAQKLIDNASNEVKI